MKMVVAGIVTVTALVFGAAWRAQKEDPRVCLARLKTLAGAWEMYNLDK